jgi:DNA polymerase-3 subunit chi
MSRIDFYHIQKQSLEEVLPVLLAKAYDTGNRVCVKTNSEERVAYWNNYLWTYNDESFLPHGSKKDGFAAQQPILLTADSENINDATFLFLTDGAEMAPDKAAAYTRIFNLFDGNSAEALAQARTLWKTYKDADFEVYYWQQNERGKWEQKA